jgi:lipoprotein-releasing system permease protein
VNPSRPRLFWFGALLFGTGAALSIRALIKLAGPELVAIDLATLAFGWGSPLEVLGSLNGIWMLGAVREQLAPALMHATDIDSLLLQSWLGLAGILSGALLFGFAVGETPPFDPTPTEALGIEAAKAPLHPRLANWKDFHWSTLGAYSLGILLSEVAVVQLYIALVASGTATATSGQSPEGLSPVAAFLIAFGLALLIAFAGGVVGAAASRRISTPEATIALLYFGLPIPIILSAMYSVPFLMLKLGHRLREITYLSSMLGDARPEMGYWLVFVALALALFLGINFGFVATASGKLDLRAGFELFVAARHVQVFQPALLSKILAVLLLGIGPPLLLRAIVRAARKQVERTRIRKLGLKNPLAAADALHKLRSNEPSPTMKMTEISVTGVGVGVMALIVVLSVMSGFEQDLQKKILGTNSHGVVLKYTQDMPEWEEVLGKVQKVKGITGATPFILNEVMVSSEGNISGSMIKGIDPGTVGTVTDLPEYMLEGGSLQGLEDPSTIKVKRLAPMGGPALDDKPAQNDGLIRKLDDDPMVEMPKDSPDSAVLPGIVLGKELASVLRVKVGDRLNVVSPLGGELGPQGPMPKSRPFRVAGIFYSGMFEYDSKFVYIHLREAQTFFGLKGATGIELKVDDIDDARRITRSVYDTLEGYPYRTKDWGEMNRNLFAALRLEKLVMGIILSMIIVVAAGLIVATVIMLVLEKRKEISVLKALGVPDGGIVKIFLAEGLQIGVAGGLLGLIAGLAWCLFIEKVGIRLDPQVYYIPALPVRIEPLQTALAVIVAVLITFLASISPALQASEVEPVEGLKAE